MLLANSILSIVVVSAIVAALYGLVRFFSRGEAEQSAATTESAAVPAAAAPVSNIVSTAADDFSAGDLKLVNVDERTAAMVMAIVSDESGIPLSELCFKSIKEVA